MSVAPSVCSSDGVDDDDRRRVKVLINVDRELRDRGSGAGEAAAPSAFELAVGPRDLVREESRFGAFSA